MIEKQFKSNVGLFLVCAELSKKNLIALPTSRNTEGYDIILLNPKNKKSSGIQVKCSDKKEFPVFNSYWKDYERKIEEKVICDFIFVDISDLNNVKYFILSKEEVKDVMKLIFERYTIDYLQRKNLTLNDIYKKENNRNKKLDLWSVKLKDIESYKEGWEKLF